MGTAALDHIFTGMAGEKVLHTQSREYIVDDLLDVMKERGVEV